MLRGRIKWYDSSLGYGFIVADEREYFVMADEVLADDAEFVSGSPVAFHAVRGAGGFAAREVVAA